MSKTLGLAKKPEERWDKWHLFFCYKPWNNSPVHLNMDLESWHLILSLYFFFKNAKKNASGGLILSLEKFGLISYSIFFFKKYLCSEKHKFRIN